MNRILYITLIALLTVRCSVDNKTIVTLKVINELQDCEENNMFYRIIEADSTTVFNNIGDSLVLLSFVDSIKTQENYDFFFPRITKHRYEVELKGYFERERAKIESYGCIGSRKFRITEIVNVRDVTKEMDFSIEYK